MKVDVFHRAAVHAALRLRQQGVDGLRVRPNRLRQVERVDQRRDVAHRAAVGVVHLLRLFLAVHRDGVVRSRDAAGLRLLCCDAHARQAERVDPVDDRLRMWVQLQQRRAEHIARRAHAAVQIQLLHGLPPK